ncbi:MAG: PilZ domain-containing protein [Acidobacteria bacterium]|nr:PilZ domain-containing protein [Acidobacteriota bacterium]
MNRRTRTRFKTDLTVNVTCVDPPGSTGRARLSDLSVHGLSLILGEALPEGALVRVDWGDVTFTGELVYCKPQAGGFVVGLKVEDPVYETARKCAMQ